MDGDDATEDHEVRALVDRIVEVAVEGGDRVAQSRRPGFVSAPVRGAEIVGAAVARAAGKTIGDAGLVGTSTLMQNTPLQRMAPASELCR